MAITAVAANVPRPEVIRPRTAKDPKNMTQREDMP